MCWVMVDVEADGPIPGDYSMVAIGAVKIEPTLQKRYFAELAPISEKWNTDSLAICNYTREQTLQFGNPLEIMKQFSNWLDKECGKDLLFISDNTGFDWQFINWYFHHFLNGNPFGYNSTNLASLYKGLVKDMHKSFQHFRKTPHTHNALTDALGNAEALLTIKQKYGLKIKW